MFLRALGKRLYSWCLRFIWVIKLVKVSLVVLQDTLRNVCKIIFGLVDWKKKGLVKGTFTVNKVTVSLASCFWSGLLSDLPALAL